MYIHYFMVHTTSHNSVAMPFGSACSIIHHGIHCLTILRRVFYLIFG